MGAEVNGILQIQAADQPLLFVQQLAKGAFLEKTLLHVVVQPTAGLSVQRSKEQQMGLHRVDQRGGGVGVFLPQLRAATAEDRVEAVVYARVGEAQELLLCLLCRVALVL